MVRREKRPKDNPECYLNLAADLPDYQPHVSPFKEYENLPRENAVWYPVSEQNDCWIPRFISIAQSILTDVQEFNGVSTINALENASNDYGLEYILKILHETKCAPKIALERLISEKLPRKLVDRWTIDDVMDIVEFYYTWKRSGRAVKGLVASRARRFYKKCQKSSNLMMESPHAHGVITRSRTSLKDTCAQAMKVSSIFLAQKHIFKGVKRKRRIERDCPIEQ